MSAYRRGYVLSMWTGLVENPRTGRPIIFRTIDSAYRYIGRLPAWGRHALSTYRARTRPGVNGKPDYILTERNPVQ